MPNQYEEAQSQYKIIYDIATIVFKNIARSEGLLVNQVAIVANYDSVSDRATVYFPSDLNTQSNYYPNLTGKALSSGQKVYLFHKYGDVEQGWIMA